MQQNQTIDPNKKLVSLFGALSSLDPSIKSYYNQESFIDKFSKAENLSALYNVLEKKYPNFKATYTKDSFVSKFRNDVSPLVDPDAISPKSDNGSGNIDILSKYTDDLVKSKEIAKSDTKEAVSDYENYKGNDEWIKKDKFLRAKEATKVSDRLNNDFISMQTGQMNWQEDWAKSDITTDNMRKNISNLEDSIQSETNVELRNQLIQKKENLIKELRNEETSFSQKYNNDYFNDLVENKKLEFKLREEEKNLFPEKEDRAAEIEQLQKNTDEASKKSFFELPSDLATYAEDWTLRKKRDIHALRALFNEITGDEPEAAKFRVGIINDDQYDIDKNLSEISSKKKGGYAEEYVPLDNGVRAIVSKGKIVGARDSEGYQIELTKEQVKQASNLAKVPENIKTDTDFTRAAYSAVPSMVDMAEQIGLLFLSGGAGKITKLFDLANKPTSYALNGGISFYQMYGSEYSDALSNGYNPDAANDLALAKAATTSLLEVVNPLEVELAKRGLDVDFEKIRTGVTGAFLNKKLSPPDLLNTYIYKVVSEATKGGKKELVEEVMQGYFSNMAGNAVTGNSENYTFQDALNDGVPAFLIGALGGGYLGYSKQKSYIKNKNITEVMNSLDDPSRFLAAMDSSLELGKITKEDHDDYIRKFNRIEEEVNSFGDLEEQDKAKVISLVLDLIGLEEDLSKASTDRKRDSIQKEIDKINAKLDNNDTSNVGEPDVVEPPVSEERDQPEYGGDAAPTLTKEEESAKKIEDDFEEAITSGEAPEEVLFESESGYRVVKIKGFSVVQRKLGTNKWVNDHDQESDGAMAVMAEYNDKSVSPFINTPYYTAKDRTKKPSSSKSNPNRIRPGERITFVNKDGTKIGGSVTKINKDENGKVSNFVITDDSGKTHTLLSGDKIFSDPNPVVGDVFTTSTGEEFTVNGFNDSGEVLFTNAKGVKGRVSKDTFISKVSSGVLKRKKAGISANRSKVSGASKKPPVTRKRKITKEAEDLLSVETPPAKMNPQLVKIAAENGIEIIPSVTTPADIIQSLREIKGLVPEEESQKHPMMEIEGEEDVPSEPVIPPTDDPLKDPVSDISSANAFVNEHLSGLEGRAAVDKLEAVKISVGSGSRDSNEKSLIYDAINRAERRILNTIEAKKAQEEAAKRKEESKSNPKQAPSKKEESKPIQDISEIQKSQERLLAEESLIAVEEAESMHASGEMDKIKATSKEANDLNNAIQVSPAIKDVNVTDLKSLKAARKKLESIIKRDEDRRIKEYALATKKKSSLEGMQEDIARNKEGEEAFVLVTGNTGVFEGGVPDQKYKKIDGVWSVYKRVGADLDYYPVDNQQEIQSLYESSLADSQKYNGITYKKVGNVWRYFHPDADTVSVKEPSKIKALNDLSKNNARLNSRSGATGRSSARRNFIEGVLTEQVPNIIKALEKLVPNIGIQFLANDAYAAVAEEPAEATSRGFFHNNVIYINLDKATATTLYHEATHAAIGALFGFKGKKAEFVTELHKTLSAVLKNGNDFEKSLSEILDEHADAYLTQEGVDDIKANEYIAELAAVLAATKSIISKPSTLEKIIKVINDILEKFTNLRPIKEKDVDDMINFMNGLSASLREGSTIDGDPIKNASPAKLKQIIGERAAIAFAKTYHLTNVVENLDMAKEMYKSFMANLKSPPNIYAEPRSTTFVNFENDEEFSVDTHKILFIDYPDGGHSTIRIDNDNTSTAIIQGIYATEFDNKPITVRGTGMYTKVLAELSSMGVTSLVIPNQSRDSRAAISKLLDSEMLYNPSKLQYIIDEVSGNEISYPTAFDINKTQVLLSESMLPKNSVDVLRYIKRATGWELDTDGFWKYELLDNYDIKISEMPKAFAAKKLTDILGRGSEELFNYYPILKEYIVQSVFDPDRNNVAAVATDLKVIQFNLTGLKGKELNTFLKQVFIHEIQHIIQDHEGFPIGAGNPNLKVSNSYKAVSDAKINLFLDGVESLSKEELNKIDKFSEIMRLQFDWDNKLSLSENLLDSLETLEYYNRSRYNGSVVNTDFIQNLADTIIDLFIGTSLESNAKSLIDFLTLTPYQIYRRVTGEVEANNAATRSSMKIRAQRDFHLLRDTTDVDFDQHISISKSLENSIVSLKQMDNMISHLEEIGDPYIESEPEIESYQEQGPSNSVRLFQKDNPPRSEGQPRNEERVAKKMGRLRKMIENNDLTIEDILDLARSDSDLILGDVKELYETYSGTRSSSAEYLATTSNAKISSDLRKSFITKSLQYLNKLPSFSAAFTPKTIEQHVESALIKFSPDGSMRQFRENITAFLNLRTSSKYASLAIDPDELVALWLYKGMLEKDLTDNNLIFKNEAELLELKKQFQVDVMTVIANGTSSAGSVLSLSRHLSTTLAWDENSIIERFTNKYERENGEAPPKELIEDLRAMSKKIATLEKDLSFTLDMASEDFEKSRTAFAEKQISSKVAGATSKKAPQRKKTVAVPPRDTKEDWDSLKKVLDKLSGKGLKQLASKIDNADLNDFYSLINTLIDWSVQEAMTDAELGRVANPNTNLMALRRRIQEALELMYSNGIWPSYFPRRKEDIRIDIANKQADIAASTIPSVTATLEAELADLKDELANYSYNSISLDDIKTALIVGSPEATKVFLAKKQDELANKKDIRAFIDKSLSDANNELAKPRLTERNAKKIYRSIASIEHYINSQRRKTLTSDELRVVVVAINSAMDAARRVINSKTVGPVISAAQIATDTALINSEITSVLDLLKLTDAKLQEDQDIIDAITTGDLSVFQNINPTVRFGEVNRKINDLNDELREAKEEAISYMSQMTVKSTKDKALNVAAEVPRFIRSVKLNFDASMVLFQGHLLTGAFSTIGVAGLVAHHLGFRNNVAYKVGQAYWNAIKSTVDAGTDVLGQWQDQVKVGVTGVVTRDKVKAAKLVWQELDQKRAVAAYLHLISDSKQVLRDAVGLVINKPGSTVLTRREEFFMSKWAEKFPFLGVSVVASEAIFTTYINAMRVMAFDLYVTMNPDATVAELTSWASFINMATGVKSPESQWANNIMTGANYIFTAPKLYYSYLSLLGSYFLDPLRLIKYSSNLGVNTNILGVNVKFDITKKDNEKARALAYRIATTWGVTLFFMGMYLMIGAASEDDDKEFVYDPADPSFLTYRFNKSRIDITPVVPYFRHFLKLYYSIGEARTPALKNPIEDAPSEKQMQFWANKVTPFIALIWDNMDDEVFGGAPLGQNARDLFNDQKMPINMARAAEVLMGNMVPVLSSIPVSNYMKDRSVGFVTTMSFLGSSSMTYSSNLDNVKVRNYLLKVPGKVKDGVAQPYKISMKKPKGYDKYKAYRWKFLTQNMLGDWLLMELDNGKQPSKEQISVKENEIENIVEKRIKLEFD